MSLAQRVRDIRYAKGWGPDELANRAEISRTALYQIESGKTGLPRAGTLRRIAVALDVPMEDLLGYEPQPEHIPVHTERNGTPRRPRALYDWMPSEGGPLALPGGASFGPLSITGVDESRFSTEPPISSRTNGHDAAVYVREGEMMSKLHDLLHSAIGDGVARIVDELHSLLPKTRSSI